MANNKKSNTTKTKEEERVSTRDKMNVEDFMPNWKKEEDCFRDVILTDVTTGKKTKDTWPRMKPTDQIVYENWMEQVIDHESKWFPKRDQDGSPIKETGARDVVYVINRIKASGKEFLCTKRHLIGFNAVSEELTLNIKYPERRYKKVEGDKVEFNLVDAENQKARDIDKTLPVTKRLELFKTKPWNYLVMADYITEHIKTERRLEAEAEGLINPTHQQNVKGIKHNSGYLA